MNETLQPLISCLDHLSDQFRELREGVRKAVEIADLDPEMALTRARKVLEYIVRDVYERRISEPPGTRPLENLLQRLVREGFFPERLDAFANTIRKLGNLGTHRFGESVAVADVYQSLAQLMPILEWYFEAERPDAMGRNVRIGAESPHDSVSILIDRFASRSRFTVVPRGLRAFDRNDRDFFLNLLPGPRDKDGFPDSICCWKHRIESTDDTFDVAVIYGPSGCGKSSWVKAGLLPNLSDNVLPIYVDATTDGTEVRLLKALTKRVPHACADLVSTIKALRNAEKKTLIVIDQFEQWLHSHSGEHDTELSQALRQCDGERVQCILLIRDDFWLGLSRFMDDLHVELVQGRNMAMVDLFDSLHARNVLAAFGRAYGRLNDPITSGQAEFLDKAVQGLARDGRIVCVKLVVFAEMVKAKPWTAATLDDLGGMEGIGVGFLEETISSPAADTRYRMHADGIRAALKALLPEKGTNIKGHMRSYEELLAAAGYQDRSKEFLGLLGMLDKELRLITPTDPQKADADSSLSPRYFQLTHDYLVPSLREWLSRNQTRSRRGRAELRLEERAALWNEKPENRYLVSSLEYLSIRLLTDRKTWSEPQLKMMRKAGQRYGILFIAATTLIVVVLLATREAVGHFQAASLVNQLMAADLHEVTPTVAKIGSYRRWVDPLLRSEFEKWPDGSRQKLYAAVASVSSNPAQVDYLYGRLLEADPEQLSLILESLDDHKEHVIDRLWEALSKSNRAQQILCAASGLARFAPDDVRWDGVSSNVARQVSKENPYVVRYWVNALRPVGDKLLPGLIAISLAKDASQNERFCAINTVADYAADKPDILFHVLVDSDETQFPIVFDKLATHRERIAALAREELSRSPADDGNEAEKDLTAKRRANAAIALYHFGDRTHFWPMLQFEPDARARTYIIQWLAASDGDYISIFEHLEAESNPTIRRALLLLLGEFSDEQLTEANRRSLCAALRVIHKTAKDPGEHGAAEWLLRRWGEVSDLAAEDVQASKRADGTSWRVNTLGQTLVILEPVQFMMGSALREPERSADEEQHLVSLRRFAIAAAEVTKAQYRRFQEDTKSFNLADNEQLSSIVSTEDSPQTAVTWYEAASYCNWLSKIEGISDDQWCYEPNENGEYGPGMKAKEKFWEREGYRLPTEAEWEYACRAGTVTSRYYGFTEGLLPHYAVYLANGENRTWPVTRLQPNDFGLFGMMGNAYEWCFDEYASYQIVNQEAVEDTPSTHPVEPVSRRVLRGGSFATQPRLIRSASRNFALPNDRKAYVGFRLAKSCPQ